MAKVRISTTVDAELIAAARAVRDGTDASLVEDALRAYLATHRAAEIDAAYAEAYRQHPLEEPDEWGDLASFHETMGRA